MNPAKSSDSYSQFGFSQTYLASEFKAQITNLVCGLKQDEYTFFGGARFLGFDPIKGFDDNGKEVASYGAYALKLQLGLHREIIHKLFLGFSLGYVLNSIESFFYQNILLDLGWHYPLLKNVFIAGSFTNVDLWRLSPSKEQSPTTLQVGFAYKYSWDKYYQLNLFADLKSVADEKIEIPLGISFRLYKWFIIHCGSSFLNKNKLFSLGFGFKFLKLEFDYATEIHSLLSLPHTLNILFYF